MKEKSGYTNQLHATSVHLFTILILIFDTFVRQKWNIKHEKEFDIAVHSHMITTVDSMVTQPSELRQHMITTVDSTVTQPSELRQHMITTVDSTVTQPSELRQHVITTVDSMVTQPSELRQHRNMKVDRYGDSNPGQLDWKTYVVIHSMCSNLMWSLHSTRRNAVAFLWLVWTSCSPMD